MNFDAFTTHKDPIISRVADQLNVLTTQFQNNQLSSEEYKELVSNLLDFKQIANLAIDANKRTEIAKTFQQLFTIAGIIGSFI